MSEELSPARTLALVRIAVGAIFIVRTTPLLMPLGFRFAQWPLLGWPTNGFHVAVLGLPAAMVAALAIIRTLAALSFLAGFHARIAGVVASVTGYIVLGEDSLSYVNSLHLLFMSTLVVALTDSKSLKTSVWLVRGLPLSVYAFSALAKLNAQFLSGRALLGFCDDGYLRGIVAGAACASPERAHFVSLSVVLAEATLPVLLVLRRTRRYALLAAIVFHVTIELTMHPDVFGWLMAALLIAFVAKD